MGWGFDRRNSEIKSEGRGMLNYWISGISDIKVLEALAL
jgi:hypothetical protein